MPEQPEAEFDPYRKWLGIPVDQQPPSHYRLLGLADFEKDPDVIDNAAQRCSAHVKTFQVGERTELAKRILKELAAAQRCLLNPKTRKAYDTELRKHQPPPPPVGPAPDSVVASVAPVPKVRAIPVQPNPAEAAEHPLAEMGTLRAGSTSRTYQKRSKRGSSAPWLLLLGLAAFLLAAGVFYVLSRERPPVVQTDPAEVDQATPQPPPFIIPAKQPEKDLASKLKERELSKKPIEQETLPSESFDNPTNKPDPDDQASIDEAATQQAERLARAPVPEGEPLQAARRWIRENFRDQFLQTKTPASKQSAIEVLIEAAGEPDQVLAQRYVLLQRASDLAIELIDVPMLTNLNRELATHFDTDYYNLQSSALAQAERKASSTEQGRALYAAASLLLSETRKLRRYDVAIVAAEVAGRSARRAGELAAQRAAEEVQKELKLRLAAQQAGTEPGPLEKLPPGAEVTPVQLKAAGLIGHWKFDELDGKEAVCSVSGRRSPIRGNPRWVQGRIGGGLELTPGTYVVVSEGPKFDKNDAYTLAAWVKTSHPEPMAIIARTDDAQGFAGFDLSLIDLVPYAVLVHRHPDNSIVTSGSEAFSSDAWHHLAATHDGSGRAVGMKLYVDGVPQTSNVLHDSLDASTLTDAPLHIGQRNDCLGFTGTLDDVRIYNRALTSAEIATLARETGKPR